MPINASPVPIVTALTALAVTAMTPPVALGEIGLGASVRGLGSGSERTAARKRIALSINRTIGAGAAGAIDGQVTLYGCFLPDPLSGSVQGNAFLSGDSSATAGFGSSAIARTSPVIAQNANSAVAVNGGVALLNVTATTATQPATIAAGIVTNLHLVVLNGVLLRHSSSPAAGTAAAAPENTFLITAGVITLYAGATGAWAGATGIPAGSEVVEYFVAAPQQVLATGTHFFEHVTIGAPQVIFMTATVAQTGGQTTVVAAHLVD
jgi:hypothetical protein